MRNSDTPPSHRFPALMRGGFALLAAGVVGDLGFHAIAAFTGADISHTTVLATAIHALVLGGMVATFGGLIQVAIRPQGAVTRKESR